MRTHFPSLHKLYCVAFPLQGSRLRVPAPTHPMAPLPLCHLCRPLQILVHVFVSFSFFLEVVGAQLTFLPRCSLVLSPGPPFDNDDVDLSLVSLNLTRTPPKNIFKLLLELSLPTRSSEPLFSLSKVQCSSWISFRVTFEIVGRCI